MHNIRKHYPPFIAHTDSCARPKSSWSLQLSLLPQVFAGCCQPLLEVGPSRRYLRNLYTGAWTLTPQCLSGAFTRFFPESIGLTSDLTRSAHQKLPVMQFQQGHAFSRLQSFLYVQAPMLARPPDCTHRWEILLPGRPGRLHHAMDMRLPCMNCGIATCLNRAIDMAGLSPARLRPCRPLPRSGREGFPHPVPRLRPFLPDHRPARRHPGWRVTLLPANLQIRYYGLFWVLAAGISESTSSYFPM